MTEAEMDIRNVRMALLRYAMQDGKYPTTEQGLQALLTKPTLPPEPAVWEGPYIDPEFLVDPWNNKYIYRSPSTEDPERHKYDLCSYGPDGKEGGEDDITVRDIEKKLEGK
jgi:general secretion pathway protein G